MIKCLQVRCVIVKNEIFREANHYRDYRTEARLSPEENMITAYFISAEASKGGTK